MYRLIAIFYLCFIDLIPNAEAQHVTASNQADLITVFSSNLPIVVINTNNQQIMDEPRIVADMGIIYNGVGVRNYLTDPYNHYDGKIAIEIRGSTSLSYLKKSYRMETQDANGNNLNVSLLGMPAENDWVLYAPIEDRSYMNNVLAFKWSNEMGRYAPRTRYCELFINGQNQGLYVLMEKIKRDANRLDIYKMSQVDTSGIGVTGGYILKIDRTSGCNCFFWDSPVSTQYPYAIPENGHMRWQIEYPKLNNLQQQQITYIKSFIDSFELTMAGPDFNDPLHGYLKYIDVASFVDHVILQEFTKNVDAYRLSAYLYKDNDFFNSKLNAGPLWDFNRSMWHHASSFDWTYTFYTTYPNYQVPEFWKRLLTDNGFKNAWKCRWLEVESTVFNIDSIFAFIDSTAAYLDEAAARDVQIWQGPNDLNSSVVALKNFITARKAWLLSHTPGDCILSASGNEQPMALHIYPNPAAEEIYVSSQVTENEVLHIVDMTGRQVISLVLDQPLKRVDVSGLANGVYLCLTERNRLLRESGKLVISR